MFENIGSFFRKIVKPEQKELGSKDAAKERLHLVLMQDRANVSADFLELMKQEIIDVIKKYIIIDESAIDVRLTNQSNDDGTNGAPALYANIPIVNIKNDMIVDKIKKFEGIDFNKEVMGTPEYEVKIIKPEDEEEKIEDDEDTNNEEKTKIEEKSLLENITEKIDKIEDKIEDKIDDIKDKIEGKIDRAINTDTFENEDIDEEDDDDITFDDLLKAAEEEDKKMKNNQNNEKENDDSNKSKKENQNKGKKEKKKR